MEINFSIISTDDLEKEVDQFKKFRESYVDVITGRREPNDDEEELQRLGLLSDIQTTLDSLLYDMKEAKAK